VDPRVSEAIERFHSEWRGRLPIHSLARSVGMSPREFQRVFRAQTGLTPRAYVRRLRLALARLLLERKDLSVKEICAVVGFSALNHFVTEFRKAYGRPPGEFRKTLMSQATCGGNPLDTA
jgi:transcriptional regulator GlxA family with amidase domain